MSNPVSGLILAHASLATGLAAAARQITGADDQALRGLSNDGQGPEGIVAMVNEAAGDAPTVIFTDLGSGSCAFAARKIAQGRPGTAVVCGVNLPMLIDFVFHRELPLQELVSRLLEKGRAGIIGTCAEEAPHGDRSAPS